MQLDMHILMRICESETDYCLVLTFFIDQARAFEAELFIEKRRYSPGAVCGCRRHVRAVEWGRVASNLPAWTMEGDELSMIDVNMVAVKEPNLNYHDAGIW